MPLLGLPPELFERIAQFADTSTLCALRLVCRDANAKAFRTFRDTQFTTRRTYLTEIDLRILLEIVEHPQFAPAIERLEICIDELDERHRWHGMQNRLLTSQPSHVLQQARSQQHSLRATKLDLHLLTFILCRLNRNQASHRGLREIMMLDGCRRPHHHSASHDLQLRPPLLNSHGAMWTIAEALDLSLLRPATFVMQMVEWSFPVHSVREMSVDRYVELMRIFQNVKRLKICVWFDHKMDHEHARTFAGLLSGCRCEELEVNIKYECEDVNFSRDCMDTHILGHAFLQQTYGPQLKKLKISGFEVDVEEMFDFLQAAHVKIAGVTEFCLEDVYIKGRKEFSEDTSTRTLEESLQSVAPRLAVSCIECVEDWLPEDDETNENEEEGGGEEDNEETGDGAEQNEETDDGDEQDDGQEAHEHIQEEGANGGADDGDASTTHPVQEHTPNAIAAAAHTTNEIARDGEAEDGAVQKNGAPKNDATEQDAEEGDANSGV